MIKIKKDGLFYSEHNQDIKIEDSEVLSFLREPILELESGFNVKYFIDILKEYEAFTIIIPEISEIIDCYDINKDTKEVGFDKIAMSIAGNFNCIDRNHEAQLFLMVQSIILVSSDFVGCFPCAATRFKNIINSEIIISSKFNFSLNLDEQEIRSHLSFNISQYTLFDFISCIGSSLVASSFREKSNIEDDFTNQEAEILNIKKTLEKVNQMKSSINDENVNKETIKVLDTINNLINKDKE